MHSPHFSFVWDLVVFIMYASCSHGWVVTLLADCDWNSVHVDHCLTSASNCQIGNWQISTKLWWSLIFLMLMVSRLKEIVLIFHFTYLSYSVNQTTGFFCFILVFFLFSLGFWYLSHAFWLVAVLLSEYSYSFFTSSLKYFQVDWIISMSFSTLENTLSYAVLLSMIFPFFLLPVVFYKGSCFDLEISLHLASVDLLDSTFKHTIKLEKMKLVFIFVANLW